MKNYTAILLMILGLFLAVSINANGAPPVNDNFANAIPIPVASAGSVLANNHDATKEPGEPNHAEDPGAASVWFTYTPTTTTAAFIRTAATSADTLLGVYTGTSVNDLTLVGYNDDCGSDCGDKSGLTLKVNAGTTYYIAVDTHGDGSWTITGQFLIAITELPNPLNDHLYAYHELGAAPRGSIAGTNFNATVEPGEPGAYTLPQANGKSVWYRWTSAYSSRSMTFELTDDFDSQIAVYTANVENPTFLQLQKVARNTDAFPSNDPRYRTTFFAEVNKTYYIKIDWHNLDNTPAETGNFQLKYYPSALRYSARLNPYTQKSSLSLFRPADGVWYSLTDMNGAPQYKAWGKQFDKHILADFDGDGESETVAVRGENGHRIWYIPGSTYNSYSAIPWGLAGDFITFGDFDADGRADMVAIRYTAGNYVWYVRQSSNAQLMTFTFGITPDKPAVGDFDGDGRTDLCMIRLTPQGLVWHLLQSDGSGYDQYESGQFGIESDIPTAEDFDGDGKTDIAVFRPSSGTWYIRQSGDGQLRIEQFGLQGDKPQPADYNGDGKADLCVFRPSEGMWYIAKPNGVPAQDFDAIPWGLSNDVPVTSFNSQN